MNPESILGTPVGDVNTPWMGYQSITGHLLAFFLGRWEETVEPKESPHKHVENTQNSTQTQNLGAASWKSYSLHHRASHLEKNHKATKNLKVYYGGKKKIYMSLLRAHQSSARLICLLEVFGKSTFSSRLPEVSRKHLRLPLV